MSNATKVNKGKPQQNEEQAASPIKSNATKANEVVRTHQPEPASKYANTSNEASLVEKEVRDAIVVFSSNFDVALINLSASSSLTKDHIQAMLDQALTRRNEETQMLVTHVMAQQREETRKELQAYVEQQRLENKQYKQSIQSVVAT